MTEIFDLNNIQQPARKFINLFDRYSVFAFYGSMGAGKTTFIKAVCEILGVKDTVNSPTFSIINEYEAADGRVLYHFDCYRINKLQEAIDLGAEDYFYSGKICFIEWPEKIEALLPDSTVKVNIQEVENGIREIEMILPTI
ncbi:MAG TPA: tRNA (adenosine(37)-N6)-threonylcarbamoyltransferase complex ATPase subunit type 1 TsaE [Paludibacteraceae bacterium]|jgi:tRNA threonylcarbamoyladenosine biosynthesis protein TsaE|nr:tRNA (adenosine(37)-N6)-threonylcarbamoyltransferase complex ATPase subunit type 1 TsaE [Paludibacteraceae bacterium]OPZ03057.1 MAG: tRNA threonylcarbamoyladenosine biosynthesis protein TsaE [Bacteroidetes bacterium ADurb.BinA395]HOF98750.1 tRNA (adenosine(37)-N6)-threonylcarbamoyltransferase complex ATPase subunit type 1 TsaE [Paludibacteraceae bacterium]HOJ65446.1 tRNA (adenosine(37)-N6)-threonylcarbamoyltransferase complex ATPase subunit type 1 TsaE [Paludibacteraceae bacterium]HOL28890.1